MCNAYLGTGTQSAESLPYVSFTVSPFFSTVSRKFNYSPPIEAGSCSCPVADASQDNAYEATKCDLILGEYGDKSHGIFHNW